MPYRCAFGCTSYNPSCDACDEEISDTPTGWFGSTEREKQLFEAAKRGMTLEEYLESEDD